MVYTTIEQLSQQFVNLYVKLLTKSRSREKLQHIINTSKYQPHLKNNIQSDLEDMYRSQKGHMSEVKKIIS